MSQRQERRGVAALLNALSAVHLALLAPEAAIAAAEDALKTLREFGDRAGKDIYIYIYIYIYVN